MKYPKISGFVGVAGDSVWMDPNGFPDDHPVVRAHPDLFTDVPPPGVEAPKSKRGRPSKYKPVGQPRSRPVGDDAADA